MTYDTTVEQLDIAVSPGAEDLPSAPFLTDDQLRLGMLAHEVSRKAEELDVPLRLADLALAMQVQPGQGLPRRNRWIDPAVQLTKRMLPFTKSREQKFAIIRDSFEEEAYHNNDEIDAQRTLQDWLGELSPSDIGKMELEYDNYGDKYLSPVRLLAGKHTQELGRHFNYDWDDEEYARLPSEVRDALADRKEFWAGFGLENAHDVETFIDDTFEKVALDLTQPEACPELRWLQAKDAEAYESLLERYADGDSALSLWRLKQTPDVTIQKILQIGKTQEGFITTWLPTTAKRSNWPTILPEDKQAVRQTADVAMQGLAETASQALERQDQKALFEAGYQYARLQSELAEDSDFEGALYNIDRLRSLVYGLEIDGRGQDAAERELLDRVNGLFDEELSGELASFRFLRDTVHHNTDSIRQSLRAILKLEAAATALQYVQDTFGHSLPPWLFAIIAGAGTAVGSLDDFVGEYGEAKSEAIRRGGWREVLPRYKIIIPAALGAVALGTMTGPIARAFGARFGAIANSFSAYGTTASTLQATKRANASSYMKLAGQGKLQDRPYFDESMLHELGGALQDHKDLITQTPETMKRIKAMADKLVTNSDVSQAEMDKRLDAISQKIRQGLLDKVPVHVTPTKREARKAANYETFGIHAARRGKLKAMPLMTGAAALLGGVLIGNDMYMAAFGSAEGIGGLVQDKINHTRDPKLWDKTLEQLIARQQPGESVEA